VNHRRSKPRHDGSTGRERSSNWVYPQVERGSSKRSRASSRRRMSAVNADLDETLRGDQTHAMPRREDP
jgi:hypothetical protein